MMGHLSAGLRQKLTQAVLALYTKDAYRIEKRSFDFVSKKARLMKVGSTKN